jgi:hypothetical protein
MNVILTSAYVKRAERLSHGESDEKSMGSFFLNLLEQISWNGN